MIRYPVDRFLVNRVAIAIAFQNKAVWRQIGDRGKKKKKKKTALQRKCHNALYIRRSSRSPLKYSWLVLQSDSLDSRRANFTLSRYASTKSLSAFFDSGHGFVYAANFLLTFLDHTSLRNARIPRERRSARLWMRKLSVPRNRTRYFRYYCEETSGLYRPRRIFLNYLTYLRFQK